MDAHVALDLAVETLQFISYGVKIVTYCVDSDRSAQVHDQVKAITLEMSKLNNRLMTAQKKAAESGGLCAEELALQSVAAECITLGKEFSMKLRLLVTKSSLKKYSSLRDACVSVWVGPQVDACMKQLKKQSNALRTFLLATLSDPKSRLRNNILIHIHDLNVEVKSNLTTLVTALPILLPAKQIMDKDIRVLDSLRFATMDSRYSRIPPAYAETFRWIYSDSTVSVDSSTNFTTWLQSGDGIYWITGKPGSGKSTLMKYLYENKQTVEALRSWTDSKELIIAHYYFWNSGTAMQKSQQGFLQSIIYNVLRQTPGSIREICNERWENNDASAVDRLWAQHELMETFLRLQAAFSSSQSTKLCLFIDGLDEHDGDHLELIKLMQSLVHTSNVKVCLSSRPWKAFMDAFAIEGSLRLRLEDLTKEDMRLFVMKRFAETPAHHLVIFKDPRFPDFVSEVVRRGQGVFLWVSLVVRRLLRTLHPTDTIENCLEQLELVPTDLYDYFRFILDSIDRKYHEKAAQLLQTCLTGQEPPLVLSLSLLNNTLPDLALNDRSKLPPIAKLKQRCADFEIQIHTCCSNLLSIHEDESIPRPRHIPNRRAEFLHRTLRDFLETQDGQLMLQERLKETPFNVHNFLARTFLMQIKLLQFRSDEAMLCILLAKFMGHCHVSEIEVGDDNWDILQNLEELGLSTKTYMHDFYGQVLGFTELRIMSGWVLAMAVQFGLRSYVAARLDKEPEFLHDICGLPLLGYALLLPFNTRPPDKVDAFIIEDLVARGANPNVIWQGKSLWAYFLERAYRYRRGQPGISNTERQGVLDAVNELLLCGADKDLKFVVSDSSLEPLECQGTVDEEDHAVVDVSDIVESLAIVQ